MCSLPMPNNRPFSWRVDVKKQSGPRTFQRKNSRRKSFRKGLQRELALFDLLAHRFNTFSRENEWETDSSTRADKQSDVNRGLPVSGNSLDSSQHELDQFSCY